MGGELVEGGVNFAHGCELYHFHAAIVATAPRIANANPAGW
jgi:hypothetical protein